MTLESDPRITHVGGRYELVRELGVGGSATVYLARDLPMDRLVAIKVLRDDVGALASSERFSREIRVMAKLDHPHILPVLDSGAWNDRLYYVMPYVEGSTLEATLAVQHHISIADTLRLAHEMCDALNAAHTHKIVHRDIKPSNILIGTDGHARLSDFGIARAIDLTGDDRLTDSGTVVGTVAYMSPEQHAREHSVDSRSDVFSLGMVLYECLAGERPFVGKSPQETATNLMLGRLRPIRESRPDVSASIATAIERALLPDPDQRWQSAAAFASALGVPLGAVTTAPGPPLRSRYWRRSRVRWGAIALAGLGIAVWFTLRAGQSVTADVDPQRVAVLPFEGDSVLTTLLQSDLRLHGALARFSDLTVVDPFQLDEGGLRQVSLTPQRAGALASRHRAGLVIRGEVWRRGDLLSVDAFLFDVSAMDRHRSRASFTVAAQAVTSSPWVVDSLFTALLDTLMFGERATPFLGATSRETNSSTAFGAFLDGQSALREWDLERADSSFAKASASDNEWARAGLWLAQTRSWRNTPASAWHDVAQRAALRRQHLSPRDSTLLTALVALAEDAPDRACAAYADLTRRDSSDFVAWFGLGECQRRDRAVVRDATSPSGWRFRSSTHSSLTAYRRAFALVPRSGRAFRGNEFSTLRSLLFTQSNQARSGRAETTPPTLFASLAGWSAAGDSLEFVPYPLATFGEHTPATLGIAIRRNRALFSEIARGWVDGYPDVPSPDALEALALAQEMQGDTTAIATIRRARALSHPRDAPRLVSREVWMLVRFGLSGRTDRLRRARVLSDSLLTQVDRIELQDAKRVASLALLVGRTDEGIALSRRAPEPIRMITPDGPVTLPAYLSADADALTIRAATGDSAGTLRPASERLRRAIHALAGDRRGDELTDQLLSKAALLAFATSGRVVIPMSTDANDLLRAQRLFRQGDRAGALRAMDDIERLRRGVPPGDVTLDAVFSEARLLQGLGEDRHAAEWLDRFLREAQFAAPEFLSDPVDSACLLQIIELQRDLSVKLGAPDKAEAMRAILVALRGK